MAEYFPLKLIKTAELSPEHNYIFGSHPHGIMCWGSFTAMATEGAGFGKIFPGITPSLATLDINFWLPLRRDLGLAFGCITASKESIAYQLTRDKGGRAVMIVLGGTEEALEAQEHNYSLILKRRKGFVRLALENGAHLVPTYSFGENSLYTQIVHKQGTWVRTLQTKMKEITGFAIPHFNGRRIFNYSFGVLPYRKPINIVFGAPIPVQKVANPTEEQVQEVHDKYCEALMKLFDDHKANYGICEATKIDIL
ncbi:hypothetical protein L596_030753 [Steinernema carpocapsae]|uniref:diacylglycerol O-acyltransferase n=1 Tax=Steinernema carpocapsae TaxID=34508 RepID=A0A4U5LNN5_STECR|nr:hypothetical protein L596_030753 [Steinernema carpocapsae]